MNVADIGTLLMLVFLQAVLGFDNLLYIALESKRVEQSQQKRVRVIGIGIAIALRIVMLFAIVEAVKALDEPFYILHWEGVVTSALSGHVLIVLLGGGFILYTAVKEIFHMMNLEADEAHSGEKKKTPGQAIFWIVLMNLVFSFDSILGAIALTDTFWIMATAIIISGILMVVFANFVTEFLKKNRMYEVLGLFILFLVGVVLLSDGAEKSHTSFFGYEIHAMSKSTFYFVVAVLFIIELIQGRYQKKVRLELQRTREARQAG